MSLQTKDLIKLLLLSKSQSLYVYDLELLKSRFSSITVNKPDNVSFLFPVKVFPNLKVLKLVSECFDGFDISNENELSLVKDYIDDDHVCWSSAPYDISYPGFSCKRLFVDGLSSQRFNLDSFLGQQSRFGLDLEQGITSSAIHMHLGFQDNTKDSILKCAEYIEKKCRNSIVTEINLGGGFDFSSMSEMQDCVGAVSDILSDYKIYFEPGNWVTQGCGAIIGRILGVVKAHNDFKITTSVSALGHLRWSQNIELSLQGLSGVKTKYERLQLFGPTCSESDIIADLYNGESSLNLGDFIIIKGLSSYSYAWRCDFNGIKAPDLVFM